MLKKVKNNEGRAKNMNITENEKVETIVRLLADIEFGSLHIIVHNGQITQIDRTEKKRFSNGKVKDKQ